eukprot:4509173-Alexandrium_andersonii.AAC.1
MALCAGSDCKEWVLTSLCRVFNGMCGLDSVAGFKHAAMLAVEYDEWRRRFISQNHAVPLLFHDVCKLEGSTAMEGVSAKKATEKPVPRSGDLLMAGTSCKDLSTLSDYAKKNKGVSVIASGAGSSGSTFQATVRFASSAPDLKVMIFENVAGLMHKMGESTSNYQAYMGALASSGWVAKAIR